MTSLSRVLPVACIALFVGMLPGCGPDDDASTLGDWTLKEAPLQLTEELRVSETEDFYFGTVTALDVTGDGRLVVADREAGNLKVLRPDGSLLDTLGGAGEGPGEFQQLQGVQVARGDSIYAYDVRRSRLTIFAPETPHEHVRVVSIPRKAGWMVRAYVVEGGLVGAFSSAPSMEEGVSRPAPIPLRWVDETGTPGDTLMQARQHRFAVKKTDRMFRARSVPFSRTEKVVLGPDGRFYHGWTDSLRVVARAPSGAADTLVDVSAPPVPVREADRDSVLSSVKDDLRSMIASALPETKPAFTELVVANNGRLWVQRPAEKPNAETVSWWRLDPETKTIRKTRLPESVNLEVVRDGTAYGTTETEMGAPAVVRYRITSDS